MLCQKNAQLRKLKYGGLSSTMNLFPKHVTRRIVLSISTLLLVMLLAACGGTGGTASSTPAATPTPKPTPTPSVSFQTYTDSNFSIDYPQGWQGKPSNGTVSFTDSLGVYNLTVATTPNPEGAATADQLADGGITGAKTSIKNPQTVSVPPTTTVDGQTWSQRALTGTATENGQTVDLELVVLATNHPDKSPTTKGYIIVYATAKTLFDLSQSTYFLPMLQTFKFAA
jgi:hypothetical protein